MMLGLWIYSESNFQSPRNVQRSSKNAKPTASVLHACLQHFALDGMQRLVTRGLSP